MITSIDTIYSPKVIGDYNTQYRYVKAAIEGTGVTLTTTQNKAGDRLIRDIYGESNSNYSTTDIHLKILVLYGMLGGTAKAHQWNWMDTRDLNAAYRLTFIGGWTHSSTGALPNGTTGYADTYFVPASSSMVASSGHISYYSRTNTASGSKVEMESGDSTVDISIAIRQTVDTYFPSVGNITSTFPSVSNTDSRGYYIASRIDGTTTKGYKNSSEVASAAQGTGLPTYNMLLGAGSFVGAPGNFSDRECAASTIGLGLTATEALNLYNAIQAYQTSLSRNV